MLCESHMWSWAGPRHEWGGQVINMVPRDDPGCGGGRRSRRGWSGVCDCEKRVCMWILVSLTHSMTQRAPLLFVLRWPCL